MMSAMPAVQPMVFATAPQAQQSNQMQQPQDIWINNNGVWCQARIISTQAPPPTFYSLLPTPLQTQVPTAPSTPTMGHDHPTASIDIPTGPPRTDATPRTGIT